MFKRTLVCLIGTVILSNCNILNASDKINNHSLKEELNKESIDNNKHNQQYWDEFLPTIKCDARETLKDRFEYCTDKLLDFVTHDFYDRARAIDNYKYEIDDLSYIIDIEQLKKDINIRKQLFNCMCEKHKLKGHAWSAIPLKISGFNEQHQNKIGKCLFFDTRLLHNHWDMKFDKGFYNVKLNFYPSYEYQEPGFYKQSLDSEKTLSICLSAIEMDLLTSNNITSNIELFANHLISRKNKCAVDAINRYEKYFTPEQNAKLAKHIISHSLSSLDKKNNNILKCLINKYLLDDLFQNIKPNKLLEYIKNYKTDDWFEIVIKKYLDDEFGTSYNKDYLKSMQNILTNNLEEIKEIALPKFRKYISSLFTKLVKINQKIINCDDEYLNTRDTSKLTFPLTDEKYTKASRTLTMLTGASAKQGTKSMENILSYLNLDPKYKMDLKRKNSKKK